MSTIVIRSNTSTVTNVLIRDLGILIPLGGGSETFTDPINYAQAAGSKDLKALANDNAFPASVDVYTNTIILSDGINVIPPTSIDAFFAVAVMIGATSTAAGAQGLVPQPPVGAQTKFLRGDATWQPASGSSDYAGYFVSNTIGTGDIGTNTWGWWLNTSIIPSKLMLIRNVSGTLFGVETNPL